MDIKVGRSRDVVVIARSIGRQLREADDAVAQQELPAELQRVMDHLLDRADKRPRS